MTFYVLLLLVAALGGAIYLLFVVENVPGMREERVGELEPLPPDVGVWRVESEGDAARRAAEEGLEREVRTFFDEQGGKLYRQVRYRDPTTNEIVRTEPDARVKRRRIRS